MEKKEKYTKRSDGRYYTKIMTGKYKDNGKPIFKYIYAKTSRELEKKVNEAKYEIEHGMYANDKGMLFGEYAWKWLEVSKATKEINTIEMYRRIIKLHMDRLYYRKIKDITRSDIQMQINQCIDMPRTCELLKITIDQVMESAIADGLIIRNPCINISLPKYKAKEKRALTHVEKEAIKNTLLTKRERAFISILYGCGLRPQEMYALTRNDIDFGNSVIVINKALAFNGQEPIVKETKTGNSRIVQTSQNTLKCIKSYLSTINTINLFCYENGEYMKRGAYYREFNKIVKKLETSAGMKFEGLTQYTFRHNYCTELYYSGISLKEAARLMGHSDFNMIMKVYAHLDELKEGTAAKIENLGL